MKKLRYFICFSLVLLCGIGFAGCFLSDLFSSVSISTPKITLDASQNTISWVWDHDANSYILYDGETELETYTTDDTTTLNYSISIQEFLTEYKEYNFKVVAYLSEKVYKTSNTIKFLHQNPEIEKDAVYGSIVNGSELAPQNVYYDSLNYTLSWDLCDNATKYYVCAIYSTDKIYSFETTDTSVSVFNYLSSNITAFRVASNYGEEESYFSDNLVTVNLTETEDIYKEVFFFNGSFHDYYIESSQDFITVLYYSFVAKNPTINIMFSSQGLIDVMGYETYLNDTIIQEYINAITETCYYNFDYKKYSMYKYKCTFDFKSVYEPSITNPNSYKVNFVTHYTYQSNLIKPSYENYVFAGERDSEYNNFASDNKMIPVVCETSEELYWAVESGATPVFANDTCTAYTIYNNAKDVLRNIIKTDMTEYDKVLALYDYIAYNSVYDYGAYYNTTGSAFNSTKYNCFYLESILSDDTTKVAVCDGYSKTFSLLCNMEGIDCYRVIGLAVTGSNSYGAHAWNKVKVNNNWYVVDITWTEYTMSKALGPFSQNDYEVLGHTYFLVNDNYVADNHYAYANESDRNRFIASNGYNTFAKYFPTVYMQVREYESEEYSSYFEQELQYDNGVTGYVTVDRVITSLDEIKEFVEYLKSQPTEIDNAEIIIPSSVSQSIIESITNYLIDSRSSSGFTNKTGYTVYQIGDYSISSGTKSLSGTIYVFGKGTIDS